MNTALSVLILFMGCCHAQNSPALTKSGTSDENFERPCPVYDTYCIRQYFANNANCKVAYGPVPEPYYRAQSTSYIPVANITTILTNIQLKGLNGRIEEFYVNRETDKLVLTIEFRGLSLNSSFAYFRFQRRSREPVVTGDAVTVVYQSVVSSALSEIDANLLLAVREVFLTDGTFYPATFIQWNICDFGLKVL
ncbi:unnamed protein product, partial [Iphiclides podalirius]